jgi:hypothetical protein
MYRGCSHRRKTNRRLVALANGYVVLLLLLQLVAGRAFAQATVSNKASITNLPRAGLDLSPEAFYRPAINANIIANPGMELPQFGQTIYVARRTSSTFTSDKNTGDRANSWVGTNNCSVRVGACSNGTNNFCWNSSGSASKGGCDGGGTCSAGTVFSILASSTASGHDVLTCTGAMCPTLADAGTGILGGPQEDVVGCRVTGAYPSPETWPNAGWATSGATDIFFTNGKSYQGNGSLEFNDPAPGHHITQVWDGNGGLSPNTCVAHPTQMCVVNEDCPDNDRCSTAAPFVKHPIAGTWQFSFYANTSSAGATCSASLKRSDYKADFTNQRFTLTADGAWHQYTYQFIGRDTSRTSADRLELNIRCGGGVVYMDNVSVNKTTGASGPFRAETLSILKALNPGSLRNAPSELLAGATTAVQADGTIYTIPPVGENLSGSVEADNFYSYKDLMTLAHAVSSTTSPYLTIPVGWQDSDYTTFGKDICAAESSNNFPGIWVECSNENWNGGAGVYYKGNNYGYGGACARAFQVISTACADTHVHYLFNNQFGNGGVILGYLAGANFNIANTAQYGGSDALYAPTGSFPSLTGDTIAQAIAKVARVNASEMATAMNQSANGDPKYVCTDASGKLGGLSPCRRVLGAYEWSVQQVDTKNKLLSSEVNEGYGGAELGLQDLLYALTIPNPAQAITTTNFFQFFNDPNQGVLQWNAVAGWSGTTREFAPVWPQLTPVALGLELYNMVIGTGRDYHACTGAPAGIICAAFYNGETNTYQLALANSDQIDTAVSVTFPNGTVVPMNAQTVLYTKGMADNNQNSDSVRIGHLPGGVSVSGQRISFTAQALSAVALLSGIGPASQVPNQR